MTQFQFEAIVKIIHNGAPAMANELCDALIKLVESEKTLKLKLEELMSDTDTKEE